MQRTILHAGCGGENLPWWLKEVGIEGREVKLDADEMVKPDIVASIDNLGDIGPYDAVFCCHCLEHLHWHNAMKALHEFIRVLQPGGAVLIEVPNLEMAKPDNTVVYTTGDGLEVTGLDMYFGHREFSYSNPWMMHRCGFVQSTLLEALESAGFKAKVFTMGCDLLGIGVKP